MLRFSKSLPFLKGLWPELVGVPRGVSKLKFQNRKSHKQDTKEKLRRIEVFLTYRFSFLNAYINVIYSPK